MIKRINFVWKSINNEFNFDDMSELNILFDYGKSHPCITIKNRDLSIEDNSLNIEVKKVLEEISKIDFEMKYDKYYPNCYSGDSWQLFVDGKEYKGTMESPHYVLKIKKIIRYDAIKNYALNKIIAYIKA